MKVSINKKITKAMFLKGYTLTELSNKTDVGISYLSQVLHNKKKQVQN